MSMQGTFGSGGEVVFNVRIDTSQAALDVNSLMSNFNKLEMIAVRYLAIARKMGLPDDVQAAVDAIARLIVLIRSAQIAMDMLMLSNPYTFALGVAGMVMVGFSAVDTMGSFV